MMVKSRTLACASLLLVPLWALGDSPAPDAELQQLRERVIELESRSEEILQSAVAGSERVADQAVAEQAPAVTIGGALRYNVIHRDFVDASRSKYGESGFDVFRLNVTAVP